MLVFTLIFNLLLTLLNCYIAVRLWQLRRVLARVTVTLTRVERRLHRVFYPAPEFVLIGQARTHHLRQRYQRLMFQLQALERIILLLILVQRIWQRQEKRPQKFLFSLRSFFPIK